MLGLHASHLQRYETLLSALLQLLRVALDPAVVTFNAITKASLHLLELLKYEAEVGVTHLVLLRSVRIVVRVWLHGSMILILDC
jgi:hypothetical protein